MSDIDIQEIRDAFELIVSDAPEAPDFDTPFRVDAPQSSRSRRPRSWSVAVAAAAAVLVAVGVVPLLMNGEGGTIAPASEDTTVATTIAPAPIWPPAPADVTPPPGATWVCPPVGPGSDTTLTGDDIPNEVRYLPTMPVEIMFVRAYGPACYRTPALVAIEFVDSERTSANLAVVVWVESPSTGLNVTSMEPLLEEPSGPWTCFERVSDGTLECIREESSEGFVESFAEMGIELRPTIRTPDEVWTIVEQGGFTIRERNDRDEGNEWVSMVGVIDGLPVWIEASGLAIADLENLVEGMTADAVTGQVELAVPAEGIEVVHSAPVVAEVVEKVVLYWDGSDGDGEVWDGEVWLQPGYIPYIRASFSVDAFGFLPVGDTVAVSGREGGGTGGLTWQVAPGVVAHLGSDASFAEMITVAETFQSR